MAWAFHWDVRKFMRTFAEDDPKFDRGNQYRLLVLLNLLLHSNPRLRTYVSIDTIREEVDIDSSATATAVIKWLFEHGAIYNVPPDKRVGDEAKLHHRKYVFQLTGVINLNGQWRRYLLFSEEDALMMMREWETVGLEAPVDYDFLTAPPERQIRPSILEAPKMEATEMEDKVLPSLDSLSSTPKESKMDTPQLVPSSAASGLTGQDEDDPYASADPNALTDQGKDSPDDKQGDERDLVIDVRRV